MRNICCLTLLRRSCLHTVVLLCGGNGSTINSRNLRSDPRNRLPKDQLGTAANGISALVAKHTSGSVRIATNFSRKLKAAHLRIVRCAHSSEVKKTACRFQLVAPIPADTYFASRFDPTTGAGRSIPLDTYRPLNPGWRGIARRRVPPLQRESRFLRLRSARNAPRKHLAGEKSFERSGLP